MTKTASPRISEGPLAARIAKIGDQFAIEGEFLYGEELCSGHINTTYRACYRTDENHEERYILQRINEKVFKCPKDVMRNVEKVTRHIMWKVIRRRKDAAGQTLSLYPARGGRTYITLEDGGVWRCYNNIEGTHTYDVVENTRQAYQIGHAFGSFQNLISDMNPADIVETIPDFHNTPKRYEALEAAFAGDPAGRAASCESEMALVRFWVPELRNLIALQEEGLLPTRITHNDTKINNVMLDADTDQSVCVIDLDTVMPGLALYDFGDMVRTATCTAEEDEEDLSLVEMQMPFFESLAEGYLDAAGDFLTKAEIDLLPFSGKLITIEIGMRFLTDYLLGDSYFKVSRPDHNLVRARNQFHLAQSIERQLPKMEAFVSRLRVR